MKSISLIFILVIVLTCNANAQAPVKVMYFELGGPALVSFNYDMRFTKKENGLGGRIGIGGFSTNGDGVLFVPVGLNYLFSIQQQHYFEFGANVTPVFVKGQDNGDFNSTFASLCLGYRLQPKESGFLFRANINPVFGVKRFSAHTLGLAIGYRF